ncbi:MAG: Spo0B domain-containing protein [Lachnospiraceae bacterium]|nr:Spo0B domain-containing protein [Lachnospiraceae bacterium]
MTISLLLCLVLVIVLVICILSFLFSYNRLKGMYQDLQSACHHLEQLNSELRTSRHDYLNHLQVVYGLLELQEYEDLQAYLAPVYRNMQKTGRALKTSKPAINALLKAKMDEGEKRGIDFYIEVKTDLKELAIADWELCRVLSNLLDNAMTALEEKQGEKKLWVEIGEEKEQYRFLVSNNGPKIPEALQETIFRQGFSSKKEEGHGMGLYIVKNIVRQYRGRLELSSTDEETCFSFCFPKEVSTKERR